MGGRGGVPPPPTFQVFILRPPPLIYKTQGQIQESKGGWAEVKYVHAQKFHAHFGVLRGMPNWEGES